jgi:hypothetical protein
MLLIKRGILFAHVCPSRVTADVVVKTEEYYYSMPVNKSAHMPGFTNRSCSSFSAFAEYKKLQTDLAQDRRRVVGACE